MKFRCVLISAGLAADLFAPSNVQAQGTLYVSNLGQTPTGSADVAGDSWIAQDILTGSNPGGYLLNSIELLMNPASGNPGGFEVSLYSSTSGGPGIDLGNLAGSDPSAGILNYSTAGITLSTDTFYYVVLTASTPEADGAYVWSKGQQYAFGSEGWEIYPGFYTSSTGGSNWVGYGRNGAFQMGLYLTPAPEPTTLAVVGLGLTCLTWFRPKTGK